MKKLDEEVKKFEDIHHVNPAGSISKLAAEAKMKESLLGGFFDALGVAPSESYKYDDGGIFSFEYYYAQKEIDISGVTVQSAINTLENLKISDFKSFNSLKNGFIQLNPSSHVTLQILDGQFTGIQTKVNDYLTEQIYNKGTIQNILKDKSLLGTNILSDATYQSIFNLNNVLGLDDHKLECEFIVGKDLTDSDKFLFSFEVQNFIYNEGNVVGAINDIVTLGIRLEKIDELLKKGIDNAFDFIITELRKLLNLFKEDPVLACGITAIAVLAIAALIFLAPEEIAASIIGAAILAIDEVIDFIEATLEKSFLGSTITTGLGAFRKISE